MIPIGSIISLAGQAASGIMSAVNNRRMQRESDAEYARQQAAAEARAAENPLSRSENQYLMGQYDRSAKQQVENARNMAKITGATPEYGLGVQKAVSEGRANMMGQMSANASERADKYRDRAERSRQAQYAENRATRNARNQTYSNLATNAANAFGAIVNSYTPESTDTTYDEALATAKTNASSPGAQAAVFESAKSSVAPMEAKLKASLPQAPSVSGDREVQVEQDPLTYEQFQRKNSQQKHETAQAPTQGLTVATSGLDSAVANMNKKLVNKSMPVGASLEEQQRLLEEERRKQSL